MLLFLSSPYDYILSVLLFNNSPIPLLHDPLRNPPLPVKAIPANWENAVVRFQHVVACPDHDGFCQLRSDEAVYLVADLEYFLFVHRHSPLSILRKKIPTIVFDGWYLLFVLFIQFSSILW